MAKRKTKSSPPPHEEEAPASGTRLEELFGLVREAAFRTLSSVSRMQKRPWGAIFVAPDFPAVHDANMAWVDRVPKDGIGQVVLELDNATRSQGISFRHLEFADPQAAHEVQAPLVEMGFTPYRSVAMVRLGVSTCIRNPDLEVREVDTPEEWDVFDAVMSELHRESWYAEEVSRELVDRYHARLAKLKERVYLGLFGGEGAGVGSLVPGGKVAYLARG